MKTTTTLALTALALLFVSSPALADDDATHVEDRVNVSPVVTGAALLGTGYVFSVLPTIGADMGNTHYFDAMYVPVVGPFITAFQSGQPFGYYALFVDAGFVADGLVQVAGAALLAYGLASPKKTTVRNARQFSVAPAIGHGMTGVAASFVF